MQIIRSKKTINNLNNTRYLNPPKLFSTLDSKKRLTSLLEEYSVKLPKQLELNLEGLDNART
jgi:hypothetical protein